MSRIYKDGRRQKLTRYVLVYVKCSSMFERMKRKENKELKEKYGENKEVGRIEKNVFVVFDIFLKQSKKERNLMATNY